MTNHKAQTQQTRVLEKKSPKKTKASVAIVHDWLTGMRGGELVLEGLLELFPQADLYTLVAERESLSEKIKSRNIITSALQHIPGSTRFYRYFLPILPHWIEAFDMSQYELIISSSHCVAKGIKKSPKAVHISYVHAPMRYMWERFDNYFGAGRAPWITRLLAKKFRARLQAWDKRVSSTERIDCLIANSQFISNKIKNIYERKAEVVYPFVELDRFIHNPREKKDFYLVAGALAPYKRIDLVIEAFKSLELPLKIVGTGQDELRLRQQGRSYPWIEFLGPLPNAELEKLYSQCKALLFPGEEDFGITPLEAMASGAPVIAFAEGGALETVKSETGIFFYEQTAAALKRAIQNFEATSHAGFLETTCRARAAEFTKQRFLTGIQAQVRSTWEESGKDSEFLVKEMLVALS